MKMSNGRVGRLGTRAYEVRLARVTSVMPQRRVPIRYRVRPGACGSILCKLEGGNPDVLRKQKYRME